MVAFTLQTVLLMTAAYFLGAALACLIRRSLYRPSNVPVERRVDPLPEVAARLAEPIKVGGQPVPVATVELAGRPAPTAGPSQALQVSSGPQELERIHGIDTSIQTALNGLGITRYEQIAKWTRKDVLDVGKALGFKGRISRENWIEQAAVLARGEHTYFSSRRAQGLTATAALVSDAAEHSDAGSLPRPMSSAGVTATIIAPPVVAEAGSPGAAMPVSSPPLVAERAAFADARARVVEGDLVEVAAAVPVRPSIHGQDELQRISGITAEIERGLNAQGISRYSQIAQWSAADVERFEKQLLTGGRIARENWVEQAQILSRGGDTRFSREYDTSRSAAKAGPDATAVTRRTDLGSLRSVRSNAYRGTPEPGPEAAQRVAAQSKVPRASAHDDLKRIRGIGVHIEQRLNALGVTSYDHIANWTAADIERVSRSLDFKGRIERENWIEQARILGAGGQTEFSRRVDRGEVETSRPKS